MVMKSAEDCFSLLIRRIKARSSPLICGRPPRERDLQRQ
jgi:hypothetical protein